MFGTTYYHGIIRKVIVGFGRLFSDLKIPRYDEEGNLVQLIDVPIAYGPKEKWVVRTESDPSLNNNTYSVLPRLSFEILDYEYDAEASLNKMQKIYCVNSGDVGTRKQAYVPVPYNLDIALYALTKTTEDALAIVEQILPFFRPEYTLNIKTVPELNLISDVPVSIQGVTIDDQYEGDFETRRVLTHTFQFRLKIKLLGPVNDVGLIKKVEANVDLGAGAGQEYTAEQETPVSEVVEAWKILGDV